MLLSVEHFILKRCQWLRCEQEQWTLAALYEMAQVGSGTRTATECYRIQCPWLSGLYRHLGSNYSDILLSDQLKFHNLSTSLGGHSVTPGQEISSSYSTSLGSLRPLRNCTYIEPMKKGCKNIELAASLQPFLQAILFYVWGQENQALKYELQIRL